MANTIIDPPPVSLPSSLQTSPESPYHQAIADTLYQLWDALRKLGTSNSTIINNNNIINIGATPGDSPTDGGSLTESFVIACSDETTALTTGTAKVTFRMPYAFTVTDVRASVTTAPTGATKLAVDVNEAGTSILSTKLTFDSGELTTTTAATARVISDTELANDASITIDIDAVGSTIAGAGLKVSITGTKT